MPNFEETGRADPRFGDRWTHAQALMAVAVFAMLAAGCQKNSDTFQTTAERLKAVQEKQETQPDFFVPRKSVDYMSDLKAIKEAAASKEAVKQEPPKPAPAKTEARPVAPLAPAPVPAQPASAPARAAEQPVQVASTTPSARPAEDPNAIKVLAREQPEFPRDAMKQGVESATVMAKMSINAAGNVTAVTIVQATPARLFDRSVKTSLARWKFNPGPEGRSYETEISFKLQ